MTCAVCGTALDQSGQRRTYCSQVCKKRARWRRQEAKRAAKRRAERITIAAAPWRPVPIVCGACGEWFIPGTANAQYCSRECSHSHSVRWARRRSVRTCADCGAESLSTTKHWRCSFGCSGDSEPPDAERSVYFIQAGPGGPIKIGVSSDPTWRLRQLQTAHWVPLRIVSTIPGGCEVERRLHSAFAERRLMGEWFDISATDIPV